MHRRSMLLALATGTIAVVLRPSSVAAAAGLTPPRYFSAALIGASYLEDAARIGFAKGRNPQLVAFARAEIAHQVQLAARLNGAAQVAAWGVGRGGGPVNPVTGSVVGAGIGALVAGPAGVAIGAGIGATTGVAGSSGSSGLPGLPDDRRRAAVLAQLRRQEAGPAFDALFVATQIIAQQDALRLHAGYAADGTDDRLRSVARAEAAAVRRRLAQLARLQRIVG